MSTGQIQAWAAGIQAFAALVTLGPTPYGHLVHAEGHGERGAAGHRGNRLEQPPPGRLKGEDVLPDRFAIAAAAGADDGTARLTIARVSSGGVALSRRSGG